MTADVGINPKDKIGATKTPLSLVPPGAIARVAEVMKVGAIKYGPFNWREFPVQQMTYIEAAGRHLGAYQDREDRDPETGLVHLWHAAAGILILIDAIECGSHVDNRPPPGCAAKVMASYGQKPVDPVAKIIADAKAAGVNITAWELTA